MRFNFYKTQKILDKILIEQAVKFHGLLSNHKRKLEAIKLNCLTENEVEEINNFDVEKYTKKYDKIKNHFKKYNGYEIVNWYSFLNTYIFSQQKTACKETFMQKLNTSIGIINNI